VARAGWQLARNGQLAAALVASLERVGLGLGLGVGIGIALALVSGMSRWGDDLVDPSLQMLRTLPVLALVPLFILWFGIGQTSKVYMIAFACIFPVYLNLSSGIRGVDAKLLEAAKTLRLSRLQLIRHVIVPGSAASLLVGLRYASGVAWLVLVISEQINASSGVGYLIVNAQEFFRTDIVLVGVVIYALLGFLTDALCRLLERRALAWRGDDHRR
jgi:sulfonate transport system permease protein